MPATRAAPKEDLLHVGSLEKGLRVLGAFSTGGRWMNLREIAEACGLDKSAAQRFTHTLAGAGFLEKCPRTKRYGLGKRVLELAFHYLRNDALVEAASPVLMELQQRTGQRVNLSLFDDLWILYAIRQSSKREYYFSTLIGRRMPIWSSSGGRAMLAALPKVEMNDILRRSSLKPLTPKTICDLAGIRKKIVEAQKKGYALTVEEGVMGEVVVGTAIIDADGRPAAAIHIAGSLGEWTALEFEKRFGPVVAEAGQRLSHHRPAGSNILSI